MGMDCKRCEQQIWAYAEGQLAPVQVHALEAHLRECSHCQRQLEAARVAYRALRRLPRRRAPADLSARVRRRIAEVPVRSSFGWSRLWRRVALAPALASLAVVAWWGWHTQQQPPFPDASTDVDTTEALVELHEQLELADWSPSPTPSYFISTGYTQ